MKIMASVYRVCVCVFLYCQYTGISLGPGDYGVSFDADADQIVYFYCDAGTKHSVHCM